MKKLISIVVAAFLYSSGFVHGQAVRTSAAASGAIRVDNDILRKAGTAADALPGSWLSYGRTQGETRYTALKQISDTNAKRLGLEWTYVIGAGGGNQEGTPLMWNNTLYGITAWSVVFAVVVITFIL